MMGLSTMVKGVRCGSWTTSEPPSWAELIAAHPSIKLRSAHFAHPVRHGRGPSPRDEPRPLGWASVLGLGTGEAILAAVISCVTNLGCRRGSAGRMTVSRLTLVTSRRGLHGGETKLGCPS